jgi:hypothetical protein
LEDIFGWLFHSGETEMRPELGHPNGANEEDTPLLPRRLQSAMGFFDAISPTQDSAGRVSTSGNRSTPADFHPYNVRNMPLPRNTLYSQEAIPHTWRLPDPGSVIDQTVWFSILNVYDVSRHIKCLARLTSEGVLRDQIASIMSVQRMLLYLELYFLCVASKLGRSRADGCSHFAPLYPIIHRQSMGYRALRPDLLATMICIGTAFAAERQSFDLATKMVKRLRDRIFEVRS